MPNCSRKIMWLLIHEKISRWLSRRNAQVSHNQGKITPSRAHAWFESKRFDWPSVSFLWSLTNQNAWFVTSFCTKLTLFFRKKKNKKKNALLLTSQNEDICSRIIVRYHKSWLELTFAPRRDNEADITSVSSSTERIERNWTQRRVPHWPPDQLDLSLGKILLTPWSTS